MKWIKLILRILCGLLAVIVIFLAFSIQPIKEVDYHEKPAYQKAQEFISNMQWQPTQDTTTDFMVGWAAENIMPEEVSPMAGYRYRGAWESVHDSLYCRTFVLEKGAAKAALIEVDLLIFPPSVTTLLEEKLKNTDWKIEELYLSASHTHSGVGNWANGLYSLFVSGGYDEAYTESIANKILASIEQAYKSRKKSQMGFTQFSVPEFVKNRVNNEGGVNDKVEIIKFVREDSTKAALVSYTAHPTTISSRYLSISNDYPSFLMKNLNESATIDFAAYFAGPVGSHGPEGQKGGKDEWFNLPEIIGNGLAKHVLQTYDSIEVHTPKSLKIAKVPLDLEDLHMRISEGLRTRHWLFESITEHQDINISILQIGNLTMLGTPCDFSGELADQLEAQIPANEHLMINSFNGAYVGYITPDEYYTTIKSSETREMNWVGPQDGSFMMDILLAIIKKTTN